MSDEKLRTGVRRDQIAHAVISLAAERGVGGISAAAVARRVGIVPSALYRHFGSLDEAIDAALDLIRDRLLGNVESVVAEVPGCLDRLHAIYLRHIRMIEENRAVPRLVFSDQVIEGPPARKARVRDMLHAYIGRLSAIVREGKERGEVRAGVDPRAAAVLFLGLIQPPAILRILSDGRFDVSGHAGRSWELYRSALEAPRPEAGRGKR
jgi:AcrR family transcriptional regulator